MLDLGADGLGSLLPELAVTGGHPLAELDSGKLADLVGSATEHYVGRMLDIFRQPRVLVEVQAVHEKI